MGEMAVLIGVFAVTFAIGILLILRIPPRLHTPLMSMTNAVSGVTVVGAWLLLAAGARRPWAGPGAGRNRHGGFQPGGRICRHGPHAAVLQEEGITPWLTVGNCSSTRQSW